MKRILLSAIFVVSMISAENKQVFFTADDFTSEAAVSTANGVLYAGWSAAEIAKYALVVVITAKVYQSRGLKWAMPVLYGLEWVLRSDLVAVIVDQSTHLAASGIGSAINSAANALGSSGPTKTTEEL